MHRITPKEKNFVEAVHYKVIAQHGHDSGLTLKDIPFNTNIEEDATVDLPDFKCSIKNGRVVIRRGTIWDFASGAFDTKDMKVASLLHDAICVMNEHGRLSFESRRKGDWLFRKALKEWGCNAFRRWYSYLAVSAVSYANRGK